MTAPDWFVKWAADYLRPYGRNSDEWVGIVCTDWWRMFVTNGYSRGDLEAAMVYAHSSTADSPRWLDGFLDLIRRSVVAARQAARGQALRTGDRAAEGEPCKFCLWTGWVSVPHPSDIKDGEWRPYRWNNRGDPVYRCGSVVCTHCGPGRRTSAGIEGRGGEAPMSIGRYEHDFNPAWREHLVERLAAERATVAAEAASAATQLRGAVDAVLDRAGRAESPPKKPDPPPDPVGAACPF